MSIENIKTTNNFLVYNLFTGLICNCSQRKKDIILEIHVTHTRIILFLILLIDFILQIYLVSVALFVTFTLSNSCFLVCWTFSIEFSVNHLFTMCVHIINFSISVPIYLYTCFYLLFYLYTLKDTLSEWG